MQSENGSPDSSIEVKASTDPLSIAHLDSTSVKAIELYQNQVMITDRVWAYFSQYSGLLLILGFALTVFRDFSAVNKLSWGFLLLPAGAYLLFALGNRRALGLTLDDLYMVRSLAVTQTRLNFKSSGKTRTMSFHAIMIAISMFIYLSSCVYVRGANL